MVDLSMAKWGSHNQMVCHVQSSGIDRQNSHRMKKRVLSIWHRLVLAVSLQVPTGGPTAAKPLLCRQKMMVWYGHHLSSTMAISQPLFIDWWWLTIPSVWVQNPSFDPEKRPNPQPPVASFVKSDRVEGADRVAPGFKSGYPNEKPQYHQKWVV